MPSSAWRLLSFRSGKNCNFVQSLEIWAHLAFRRVRNGPLKAGHLRNNLHQLIPGFRLNKSYLTSNTPRSSRSPWHSSPALTNGFRFRSGEIRAYLSAINNPGNYTVSLIKKRNSLKFNCKNHCWIFSNLKAFLFLNLPWIKRLRTLQNSVSRLIYPIFTYTECTQAVSLTVPPKFQPSKCLARIKVKHS